MNMNMNMKVYYINFSALPTYAYIGWLWLCIGPTDSLSDILQQVVKAMTVMVTKTLHYVFTVRALTH